MAAARSPQVADGRVPCPLCGGLVHPVAGRCKHCKQDLTALRAGRPQASAALPSLLGGTSGTARAAPPRPVASPLGERAPLLPPRPTGTSIAATTPSAWRHWPIVVMAVAVLAILLAVVALVWPDHAPAHAAVKQPPPPAPEHMNTDPLPPPRTDPWDPGPATPPSPPHARALPVPPRPSPADPDPPDDPGSLSQLGPLAMPSTGSFMIAMASHLCARFHQCGTHNDFIDMYCTGVQTLQQGMPAPAVTCAEGQRCLDAIERLSCTAQASDAAALSRVLVQFPDCIDAMTRC